MVENPVSGVDGTILPKKEKEMSPNKIDGIDALINAIHPAVTPSDDAGPSVYEDRGLLRRFDGTRTPTEVHDHIRATIATLRLEEEL